MGYKADLISMMIDQRHSIGEALTTVVPEALVEICEVRRPTRRPPSFANVIFSARPDSGETVTLRIPQ